MLKTTILTCAIIAAYPVADGAWAGDLAPSSLPLTWTGRFMDVTRAPVLGTLAPSSAPKAPHHGDGNADPDIVGSIPPSPGGTAAQDLAMLRGQASSLCTLPGLVPETADDSLACGGASRNRWSAKAASFNYDLSNVKPEFAEAPTPYIGWRSLPSPAPSR